MEVDTRNSKLQEEEIINKALGVYKFAFDCPHCHREINETHFSEKEKTFQLIKERFRKVMGEEFNSHKSLYSQQWLKQMEENKTYEKFFEVVKRDKTIEELKKQLDEKKEELAKAISADAINELKVVRELKAECDRYKKENEELKTGNQPKIKELEKNIKTLEVELSGVYSTDKIENLGRVKDLKEQLGKFQKEKEEQEKKITELKSSEYIENLERVKNLVEKVDELQNENQLLKEHSRVNSKRKGELFEQYVSEELNWVFDNNKDKISKLTQTAKKADFIQEVLTENDKLAGRIIYEAKDTEKWDNGWIKKLESDMVEYKADFGIIVATCENGERPRRTDCRKRIYVTDENNFVNIAKALRHVLIQRQIYLEKTSSDSQEQRIKSFEEWISNRFPHFLSRLERELDDLNKNTISISRVAKNLSGLEDSIRKIILEEMKTDLNNLVA
jgi:hypothetical protein